MFVLNLGIRKDPVILVDNKSIQKTALKKYLIGFIFYNMFYCLLTKIFEMELLEKNNRNATDLFFVNIDHVIVMTM